MSNLQKFNTTLEDFDKEVGKLKAVSDAYQKLQALTIAYETISKQFDQNSNTLSKITELHIVQHDKILKSLSAIQNANNQNKTEFTKLLEEKTNEIRRENKDFYKDLATTIKIQLDDNKSQIKQLIEAERSQIKQIFEIEFEKKTRELREVIETEIIKQTRLLLDSQRVIKIHLWVIGGVTIILSLFSVFKLWNT